MDLPWAHPSTWLGRSAQTWSTHNPPSHHLHWLQAKGLNKPPPCHWLPSWHERCWVHRRSPSWDSTIFYSTTVLVQTWSLNSLDSTQNAKETLLEFHTKRPSFGLLEVKGAISTCITSAPLSGKHCHRFHGPRNLVPQLLANYASIFAPRRAIDDHWWPIYDVLSLT